MEKSVFVPAEKHIAAAEEKEIFLVAAVALTFLDFPSDGEEELETGQKVYPCTMHLEDQSSGRTQMI